MEKRSTIGVGNLALPQTPKPLDSHQTKTIRWNLGLTPRSHFLKGELAHWEDNAKNVWLMVGQLLIKARWWDAPLHSGILAQAINKLFTDCEIIKHFSTAFFIDFVPLCSICYFCQCFACSSGFPIREETGIGSPPCQIVRFSSSSHFRISLLKPLTVFGNNSNHWPIL